MATARERLHDMLEAVPEDRLADVEAALEPLTDPVLLAFLNAPEDDEPTTAEDLDALNRAREDYQHGRTGPFEAVFGDLELKVDP